MKRDVSVFVTATSTNLTAGTIKTDTNVQLILILRSSLVPTPLDSLSHLFSATAISHGLDTRVLLQRNPCNLLTVIKETSLPSNKISNSQLTRDAFQFAVLFASLCPFFRHLYLFIPQAL